MPGEDWLRVPAGPDSARWTTRANTRRVLLVVHNVTSMSRLLDVLPLSDGDLRFQLIATNTGSSPFQHGIDALLEETGLPVLPWRQALAERFDLAVAASYGGDTDLINSKLIILSHGVRHNRR